MKNETPKLFWDSARKLAVFCFTISLWVGLSGCGTLFEQSDIDNEQKAGSTYISVISIAPWEDYKAALQPNFSLTSADALAGVLQNTMAYNQQTTSAFGAQLKIATPGSSVSSSSVTSVTNGKPSTTSQTTESTSPGNVTNIGSVPAPAGSTALPPALAGLTT